MNQTEKQLRTESQKAQCLDNSCSESTTELVHQYLPKVRKIVFPMVLDHAAADDITQETMIRAIGGLKKFKGESSLSTWITRIALNTTYTFLHKRKKRTAESLASPVADRSFDRSPVDVAIGNELDEKVQSSLRQLSPKLRAAIVLTAIEGIQVAAAAEIEQCAVATMHWRIHEARKQLRIHLKEYIRDEDDTA